MLAYRITQFGAPLTEMKEANPAPKGTEVLLKMTGCGVCHSDVHIWEGHFDMGGGRKVRPRGECVPAVLQRIDPALAGMRAQRRL